MADNTNAAAAEGAAAIITAYVAQGTPLSPEKAEEWAFRLSRALYLGTYAGTNNAKMRTIADYREYFKADFTEG